MLAVRELKHHSPAAHASDTAHVQALFQQWKALTLELGEAFAALLGNTGEETGEADIQDMYPLRRAREDRGWTQEDLADQLNVTPLTISRWENGVQTPRAYYVTRLCRLFNQAASELGLADERKPGKPNLKLRHSRKMRNWTQSEMADELYRMCKPGEIRQRGNRIINANMIGGWERGEHVPGPFWQKKLCKLFGTTPDSLGFLEAF